MDQGNFDIDNYYRTLEKSYVFLSWIIDRNNEQEETLGSLSNYDDDHNDDFKKQQV